MAITKVGAMTDPPGADDYAILQAKLDAYAKQIGNQGMILTQWTNTTTAPKIAIGSYITHGGTLFVVDTEDFAVPAPTSDGTYYLKVATSGATLAVSWVASTAGYVWNAIYNGLYHADESQILPYQLVKAGATLTKRKITNLMQGSGFVTVDWTGATNYVDQGVKTTDSPEFANYASKTLTGDVDLDDVIISGFYYIPSDALNSPIALYCSLTVSRNADIISQMLVPNNADVMYYRSGTGIGGNPSWRAWKQVTQSDQNLRTTDSVHFANINPPVDNNDATPPTIGIGGFTFAVAGSQSAILAPSGGTHMYLRMTSSGSIWGCGRIAGGSATPVGTGSGTDYAFFWRIG